ncbi:MAG: hypothetical protein ACXVMS_15480 [Flavisolibacter sp.]
MATCNFSIPFTGLAEDIVGKARKAVEKQGGQFQGDSNSGQFSIKVFGNITGRYSIIGQELQVVIEDKPMMIPCGMIENALKGQIAAS